MVRRGLLRVMQVVPISMSRVCVYGGVAMMIASIGLKVGETDLEVPRLGKTGLSFIRVWS